MYGTHGIMRRDLHITRSTPPVKPSAPVALRPPMMVRYCFGLRLHVSHRDCWLYRRTSILWMWRTYSCAHARAPMHARMHANTCRARARSSTRPTRTFETARHERILACEIPLLRSTSSASTMSAADGGGGGGPYTRRPRARRAQIISAACDARATPNACSRNDEIGDTRAPSCALAPRRMRARARPACPSTHTSRTRRRRHVRSRALASDASAPPLSSPPAMPERRRTRASIL